MELLARVVRVIGLVGGWVAVGLVCVVLWLSRHAVSDTQEVVWRAAT